MLAFLLISDVNSDFTVWSCAFCSVMLLLKLVLMAEISWLWPSILALITRSASLARSLSSLIEAVSNSFALSTLPETSVIEVFRLASAVVALSCSSLIAFLFAAISFAFEVMAFLNSSSAAVARASSAAMASVNTFSAAIARLISLFNE